MADHPLAGAAYGLASLANASPQTRDGAMLAGGAADAVMMSAAPFGATTRGRPLAPRSSVVPLGWERPEIRYRELNANNQATGVTATLTQRGLSGGTRADPNQTPPGWGGNGRTYNEARAHLLARQLGGQGDDPRNLITLTQKGANSPEMSTFEGRAARRVRGGEVVEYSATPLYDDGALPPAAVLVSATGSRRPPIARLIRNPAAVRK